MHNRLGHRFQRRLDVPNWLEPKTQGVFDPNAYSDKVAAIFGSDLLAYWRQEDAALPTADNYEGTAARDGTYTGVTLGQPGIGDGLTSALYDGANDYCDVYSNSLRDNFDETKGTIMLWVRMPNVGIWTDGVFRVMYQLRADPNNLLQLVKGSANNTIGLVHTAGGVTKQRNKGGVSTTDFFLMTLTWDEGADEVKAYFNNAQEGATLNGLGAWVGNLAATVCNLGARGQPANVHDGLIAHGLVAKSVATLADVQSMAAVP